MNSDSYWNTQLLDSPDNFLQQMVNPSDIQSYFSNDQSPPNISMTSVNSASFLPPKIPQQTSPPSVSSAKTNTFDRQAYARFKKTRWQDFSKQMMEQYPNIGKDELFKKVNLLVNNEWCQKKLDAGIKTNRKRSSVGGSITGSGIDTSPVNYSNVSQGNNATAYCGICKQNFATFGHYNTHCKSKKHLRAMEVASNSQIPLSTTASCANLPFGNIDNESLYRINQTRPVSRASFVPTSCDMSNTSNPSGNIVDSEDITDLAANVSAICFRKETEIEECERQISTLRNSSSYMHLDSQRKAVENLRNMVNGFQSLKIVYRKDGAGHFEEF